MDFLNFSSYKNLVCKISATRFTGCCSLYARVFFVSRKLLTRQTKNIRVSKNGTLLFYPEFFCLLAINDVVAVIAQFFKHAVGGSSAAIKFFGHLLHRNAAAFLHHF